MIESFSIWFLLIMALSGCHGHNRTFSDSIVKDPEIHSQPALTRISCQPSVEIIKNDTLVISFTEYPGRAYSWEMAIPDTLLISLKLVKVYRHSLSNNADPTAKAEFYFLGLKTGNETLKFNYFRPWEKAKPPADSCTIKVIVK
jgi:predicted secreted protein